MKKETKKDVLAPTCSVQVCQIDEFVSMIEFSHSHSRRFDHLVLFSSSAESLFGLIVSVLDSCLLNSIPPNRKGQKENHKTDHVIGSG